MLRRSARASQTSTARVAHLLYVSAAAGSDESDGSAGSPLKTLETALARIGDASPANRYAVFVSAGRYRDPPGHETRRRSVREFRRK